MESGDIGVYIHVPFCERVCPYCDFAVVGTKTLPAAREAAYVDALIEELGQRAARFGVRPLASVYFGGGTPSLLAPESIARVLEAVRAAFPGAPAETTLEVNPSTVERDRLPGFREAGVDRVSVGVQSFDDLVLKRLGRAHRAVEAHETLAACRDAGFARISLDLIYAAPDQSEASLANDLEQVILFGPDHVSAYELTLEPETPFAAAAAKGALRLPGEDRAFAMQQQTEAALAAAGYARYEISSYARAGAEAVHNRRYWERRPVLGLGVGAFSTEPPTVADPHGVRSSSSRSLERYLAAVEAGAPPLREPLLPETARGEAVFLALRTRRGLVAGEFAAEFGAAPRAFFADAIEELTRAGLLAESAAGDLTPTSDGLRLSDDVACRFV
jgi:oxygen-independent coproporphyrinogen-3 oxidase